MSAYNIPHSQPTANPNPPKDPFVLIKEAITPIVQVEIDRALKFLAEKAAESESRGATRLAETEARMVEEIRIMKVNMDACVLSAAGNTRKVNKTATKDDVAAGAAGSPAATPSDPASAPAPVAAAAKGPAFKPKNLWFRHMFQTDTEFRAKFMEAALKADPNFETLMNNDKKVSSKSDEDKDSARSAFAYAWMSEHMADWNTKVYTPMHEKAKSAAATGVKSETAKVDPNVPK